MAGQSVGSDAIALNFSKEKLESTDFSMRVLERLEFESDVM